MKYESGETFESMSLRYSMILSLLNYSGIGITVPVPKLTDGQLIEKLRKSSYSESTERLLVLFAYGMIDEKLLRFFTLGKPLKCEDTVAAESLILKFENEETSKSERYVELNSDMLDLKALANALQMCAEAIYTSTSGPSHPACTAKSPRTKAPSMEKELERLSGVFRDASFNTSMRNSTTRS